MQKRTPLPLPKVKTIAALRKAVIACRKCQRLISHCQKVAREKRRAYRDWDYWGNPVPAFGDPEAELLILGLAPGAHGANRTGRMFTGDRSGDFLYRALYRAGFASQPTSRSTDDGLKLRNCFITAALRCAPPANKHLPAELAACQPYLERELQLLKGVRAILALGKIALDAYLRILAEGRKIESRQPYRFGHGASYRLPEGLPRLYVSYHPSQQNTQTGRLTEAMFQRVFREIQTFLAGNLSEQPKINPSECRR